MQGPSTRDQSEGEALHILAARLSVVTPRPFSPSMERLDLNGYLTGRYKMGGDQWPRPRWPFRVLLSFTWQSAISRGAIYYDLLLHTPRPGEASFKCHSHRPCDASKSFSFL